MKVELITKEDLDSFKKELLELLPLVGDRFSK